MDRTARRPWELRTLAQNCLLALGSIALVLALAEIALRIARTSQGGGKREGELRQYIDRDSILGWRKRPNATAVYDRSEYSVEVRINSLGMRDPERTRDAPPGTLRLLALGDSFVEGYTVPLERTVTQQLERRLAAASSCRVEVLNGGTAGWSTDQEYLYYREEAGAFGAHVVLLFLYYNDILENMKTSYWGRWKPLLKERGGRLEAAPPPTPKPGAGERRAASRATAAKAPGEREGGAQGGSALFQFVRERLLRGRPTLYQRLAAIGLWQPIEPEAPPDEMRLYLSNLEPRQRAAWQRTLQILEALAREVAERGARLVVVYVPAAFEVDDRAWELTRLRYGLREPTWQRSAISQRLANTGQRRAIAVLDLNGALRAEQLRGATYFSRDHHWTPRGHAAAAAAVAAFLRDRGYLACR